MTTSVGRPRPRRFRGFGLILVAVGVLAACTGASSPSPALPTDSEAPLSTAPTLVTDSLVPGSPGASGLAIDATLLKVLPAAVDGVSLEESPEGEADALANAQLPTIAAAVASALAVDSASGDFVYALMVRLLPGAFDDAHFRDWRDSYDQGACSGAGGVIGNAQAAFGGRTVYIGTCSAGVRTYHTWIPDSNLLVSASAAGDRQFGEKLMDGLTP